MVAEARKSEELKFRLDSATAGLLERAKAYTGLDRSKFIRASIREKAESVIAEHEKTRFTEDDWKKFFQMMENPPAPSARMKKAAKQYQEIISHHVV